MDVGEVLDSDQNCICHFNNFHLRKVANIGQFVTQNNAGMPTHAFIISR